MLAEKENKQIKRAMNTLDFISEDPKERERHNSIIMAEYNRLTSEHNFFEAGLEEGIAKGKIERKKRRKERNSKSNAKRKNTNWNNNENHRINKRRNRKIKINPKRTCYFKACPFFKKIKNALQIDRQNK